MRALPAATAGRHPPGVRARAQADASHVLRARGEVTACVERSFEVRGASLVAHRWTYGGGWTRRGLTSRATRFSSADEARAALDAEVAKLVASGWGELPDWPELPAGWLDARPAARAPSAPRERAPSARKALPRLDVGRVRAVGPAEPVDDARLDALGAAFDTGVPRSWRALLGRLGAGTFAGRLRFPSPERAIRETRAFRRAYRDQYRTFFTNHDEVLGAGGAKLVLLASSIEGDQVAFVEGAPGRLLVLPRNGATIEVAKGLAEVLGRYAALARDVDGAAPTFAPERTSLR